MSLHFGVGSDGHYLASGDRGVDGKRSLDRHIPQELPGNGATAHHDQLRLRIPDPMASDLDPKSHHHSTGTISLSIFSLLRM